MLTINISAFLTFLRFPKARAMRIKWEIALRRDGFAASDRTLLCSDHFRSEDFYTFYSLMPSLCIFYIVLCKSMVASCLQCAYCKQFSANLWWHHAFSVHIVYSSLQTYGGIMPSVCLEQPQRLHILYSYFIIFV